MGNNSNNKIHDDSNLPNFFILGVTKSGTTSLYEYLVRHPDIYLSKVKEPQYFCQECLYRKGLRFYLDTFFAKSASYSLRGEATPHYIYFEKAARRIYETIPSSDLKFIVILRNPVDRAYSLYLNMIHEGVETLSFEEALAAEEERSKDHSIEDNCSISYQYVDSGLYAKQIRQYLKYFKREQFLFLLFDNLKDNPEGVVREICHFLGVDAISMDVEQKVHNAAGKPRFRVLQRFLREPSAWRHRIGKLFPFWLKYKVVTALLRWNKKPVNYVSLPHHLKDKLRREFESDIRDLQVITGFDLSRWLSE